MNAREKVRGRLRRHKRVRKKVSGTALRPRLAVYRSNRHIYAQLIDDAAGHTLAAASSLAPNGAQGKPVEVARAVGGQLAARAKEAGIGEAVFDRGGFRYHGAVKALAEGAREGGLKV